MAGSWSATTALKQMENGCYSQLQQLAGGLHPTHTWGDSLPGMLLLPSDRVHDQLPLGSTEALTTCAGHM